MNKTINISLTGHPEQYRLDVVTAAVTPGPSPVAKAAVVGAAVSPGRRRFQAAQVR